MLGKLHTVKAMLYGPYNIFETIISIMHKIKISTGRPFTAEQIWNKLESLYQLDMLDETEILNFQLCEKTHFRNLSKNGLFRKFPVF